MGMTRPYLEIHKWMGTPFVWGQSDCMIVLADWVLAVTGRDPARDLRGLYDDRVSCQRATGFFTDPLSLLEQAFGEVAGLPRGNDLRVGDVALLRVPQEGRPAHVGGLWLGDCWGCKGPDGTTTLRPEAVEVIAFWSVGFEEAEDAA